MKNIESYQSWNEDQAPILESKDSNISAAHAVASQLASKLSPDELETLVDFYNEEGKEALADQLFLVKEEAMSAKELKVRKIIDKIIKKGAVASLIGILPAAMAGAPMLALGLGIAALAGTTIKDAAWWKVKGHHHAAQAKHGVK